MRTILTTLHSKFIHPSLALPCLAAYCGDRCGEILIREFTVHEPKENILAALLAEKPDVIAFSVYLWNRREILELTDALAAVRPSIRVVLGGPEVSFEGESLFRRHPGIAAVVRGEGEIPLLGALLAWARGEKPTGILRLDLRTEAGVEIGPEGPPLSNLDQIPSPFALGLADLSRGFVYLETSRGCPYACAFCMSANDTGVRSFSLERIRHDLTLLMERRVPKIKLVDRTFNYDAHRAREIFTFILERNQESHFHFEIGAHLLDEATLALLEQVPPGMFQFEIGVQSTLPSTLSAIGRQASLEHLQQNVRRLRAKGNIHLHLDLIAGLPGEGFDPFLDSIDRVAALEPHHLQVEAVKVLPGSPLQRQANELGLRHDPHPPYAVLSTPDLEFEEIVRLRGIGRLLDLTFNTGRFAGFLSELSTLHGSLGRGLAEMESSFRLKEVLRHPLSQRGLFEAIDDFVRDHFHGERRETLRERLARDYARCERVVPDKLPNFFDVQLTEEENVRVRETLRRETEKVKGSGIKVQHFAAVFKHLPELENRTVLLFLYLTRTGDGMQVREISI